MSMRIKSRVLRVRTLLEVGLIGSLVVGTNVLAPVVSSASYNRSQAASYANTYWSSYNGDYESFGSTDCTNYVSQALNYNSGEEEGKPFDPSYMTSPLVNYPSIVDDPTDPSYWYGEPYSLTYTDPYFSNTWTVAQYLFWFLELYDGSNSSWVYTFHYYGGYTAPSEPSGMSVGDPFFYNWDALDNGLGANGINHASIVVLQGSGTDGTIGDEIDTHSNNRHEVLWTLKFVSSPSNPYVSTEEVFGTHVSG